jgi:hypothetical protein
LQTGQPLHVPGVSGSAHNGVSGVGGIFGVGGFLGPDYPISDSVQPVTPSLICLSLVHRQPQPSPLLLPLLLLRRSGPLRRTSPFS